ncbi:hypothetical protein FLONG3_6667 [Fusarium longipes]|uniref:Acyltransferase 3 domain-containing protein n=1 Tax=Fusarium longipes TaxID=694270 RepID=A0A395SKR1_9HYPO|nr:hypothetical protein FLONG3_6667 [Fusarium longipes]
MILPSFAPNSPSTNGAMGNTGQSWPTKLIRVICSFLPSFLHRYTPIALPARDHPYESLSQQDYRQATYFLDGMRGLAALCVFLEHLLLPFWKGIFYSYGGSNDSRSLIQLPIVRLFYSGSPMVCIFFVISGIALSLKPARLAREGQHQQLYKTLESMAFRRGMRLFLPCFVASFVHMLVAHASWCDIRSVKWEGPAEVQDEFWLKQPEHVIGLMNQAYQWLDFFVDKVLIPSTWRGTSTGRDYGDLEHIEYGAQLWTVGIEYWSSILLFVMLLGTTSLSLVCKSLLMTAFAGFSLWVGRWDVALFLFGSVLAHFTTFEHPSKWYSGRTWEQILFGLLFCFGLHFASFPELGGSKTPGFAWLPLTDNSRLWQSVGASLIVLSSINLHFTKKIFSYRLFLYLGRISFSIYVTHMLLLGVVGWRLVALIRTWFGKGTSVGELEAVIASAFVLFPLQIWVADLFCRFVDEPCNHWASRIHRYLVIAT